MWSQLRNPLFLTFLVNLHQKMGIEVQLPQAFTRNLIKIKKANTLINSQKIPIKKGAKQVQKGCKKCKK